MFASSAKHGKPLGSAYQGRPVEFFCSLIPQHELPISFWEAKDFRHSEANQQFGSTYWTSAMPSGNGKAQLGRTDSHSSSVSRHTFGDGPGYKSEFGKVNTFPKADRAFLPRKSGSIDSGPSAINKKKGSQDSEKSISSTTGQYQAIGQSSVTAKMLATQVANDGAAAAPSWDQVNALESSAEDLAAGILLASNVIMDRGNELRDDNNQLLFVAMEYLSQWGRVANESCEDIARAPVSILKNVYFRCLSAAEEIEGHASFWRSRRFGHE